MVPWRLYQCQPEGSGQASKGGKIHQEVLLQRVQGEEPPPGDCLQEQVCREAEGGGGGVEIKRKVVLVNLYNIFSYMK